MVREQLRPNNFLEVLEKYQSGCDKNCKECPGYWELRKMCVFDSLKMWRRWNKEQRTQRSWYEQNS